MTLDQTVLLVDDERAIRESLCRLLRISGWRTLLAANPAEALDVLSACRPDALILDVRMADPSGRTSSGFDLLTRLREERMRMPVVLLTGHFLSAEEEQFAQRLGATVLYKPVELRALVKHLESICAPHSGCPDLRP